VFLGRLRGRLHPGLPSTRRPDRASMDRRSAECAEVVSGSRWMLTVVSVFVWRDSLDVCGQPLQRSSQNRTSVAMIASLAEHAHQISVSFMFQRHTVELTLRERCRDASSC